MIHDVVIKELATHSDERGFFREVIRATDEFFREGFGQLSHSLVHVGVTKAWHIHKKQVDWWYVPAGVLKVALHDTRPDSPTFRETMEFALGDHQPAFAGPKPTSQAARTLPASNGLDTPDPATAWRRPARCVRIPPGVAHGYRCVAGPAHVIYVTSQVYDPADEGRIPHDDPAIGYDWLKGPAIS